MSDMHQREPASAGDMVRLTVRLPRDIAEALEHLPNRSEFVRQAIEASMETICQACAGTGRVRRPSHLVP